METVLEKMMANRQKKHEAEMQEIEAQMVELRKLRNKKKQEFKAGNRALNELCNHPTAHSIASHRVRDAHNMKRYFGGKISEWQSKYLDCENAKIGFVLQDDLQITITIPYKHADEEDALELF